MFDPRSRKYKLLRAQKVLWLMRTKYFPNRNTVYIHKNTLSLRRIEAFYRLIGSWRWISRSRMPPQISISDQGKSIRKYPFSIVGVRRTLRLRSAGCVRANHVKCRDNFNKISWFDNGNLIKPPRVALVWILALWNSRLLWWRGRGIPIAGSQFCVRDIDGLFGKLFKTLSLLFFYCCFVPAVAQWNCIIW